MILWLLACTQHPRPVVSGPWTREAALGPVLSRMDTNHDGRVEKAEYDALAYSAPEFAAVDVDGDSALSLMELDALIVSQDPLTLAPAVAPGWFSSRNTPASAAASPTGDAAAAAAVTERDRNVAWCTFTVLREEVLARDPGARVPTSAEIGRAAARGGIEGADGREVLRALETASRGVGLGFPPSLSGR